MPQPYASAVIQAPVDDVWRAARDFAGLPAWHPAISASELESGAAGSDVGAVRKLTLGDGGVVRERLVALDDGDRSQTYEILESPFPVRRYRATIRVRPVTATGGSFIEWFAEYDADGADEEQLTATFADGVFATGIAGLAAHLG